MSPTRKKKRVKRKAAARTRVRGATAKRKTRTKRAIKARPKTRAKRAGKAPRNARAKPKRAKRAIKPRPKARAKPAAVTRRNARRRSTPAKGSQKPARSRLKLVAKPQPTVPTPVPEDLLAEASSDGSAKQRMLFELVRSRAVVRAALRGLDADDAERPMGRGKWNIRQMVLHLCLRDRARIRELEATLRGVTYSWSGVGGEEMDRMNAEDLAPLADVTWEEALRLLGSTRHALREALESVPAEPSEVWTPDHPFGRMLLGLPPHDVHHAEVITRWREEQGL